MLPKTRRLPHHDFVLLKQSGQSARNSYFSLVYGTGTGHAAVVTSAKLSKNAVTRNHLRRQIYNYLRSRPLNLNLIIYPFPNTLKLSYEELGASLDSLLSKLALPDT